MLALGVTFEFCKLDGLQAVQDAVLFTTAKEDSWQERVSQHGSNATALGSRASEAWLPQRSAQPLWPTLMLVGELAQDPALLSGEPCNMWT